jgi:osmotically-inducible protein OsmY
MITDTELQRDVLKELKDEPSVDASHIGVTAQDGVVTLSGEVASYVEKVAAEAAAKRVYGVHGVAEEIKVRLRNGSQRTDADIARVALEALRWNALLPDDSVKVTVDGGWITLEGKVDWEYQRSAAAAAVRYLTGVTGVTNIITLKPRKKVSPSEVKRRIFEAFRRSAQLEARRIGIDTHGGKVILHGNVHDWSEAQAAQRAAYAVPGVIEVESHLSVVP